MRKKIIALLGVTAVVLGLFSGCGNKTTQQMTEQATNVTSNTEMTTEQSTTENVTTAVKREDGTNSANDFIGEEKVMKMVLEKVPGAKEADVRIHMDREDGVDIYEGSIVYDEMEYDFEIDAVTGKILEWESESIYD